MRQGRTFKRCTKCGARVPERRCQRCGAESFTWAYVVDTAAPGMAREQKTKAGFATKAKALDAMNTLQKDKENGTYLEQSKLSVAEFLTGWLAGQDRIRATTLMSYRIAVRRLVPALGAIPLSRLAKADVRAAYAKLAAAPNKRGAAPAVKTIHNYHLALHAALEAAVEEGLIQRNPADGAHQAPRDGEKPEMKVWTADEVRSFLALVADDDLYPLYRLAAYTGARRGELLGLRWRDIDLEAGFMSVRQQISRERDGDATRWAIVPSAKTASGRRRIDLDAETIGALRSHSARQAEHRLRFGEGYGTADLVFARPDGRFMDPDVVTAAFERQVRRSKPVPAIRFHDLRHSHATLLLIAGVPVHVVSQRLGHASPMVTLQIYAHVIPSAQRDAADRFAAVVAGP
jgi:integrase